MLFVMFAWKCRGSENRKQEEEALSVGHFGTDGAADANQIGAHHCWKPKVHLFGRRNHNSDV